MDTSNPICICALHHKSIIRFDHLKMNLQQQIFSLKTAIITAKRSALQECPPCEPEANWLEQRRKAADSSKHAQQQNSKLAKLRSLLQRHREAPLQEEAGEESSEYEIDLLKACSKSRPPFSDDLKQMIAQMHD